MYFYVSDEGNHSTSYINAHFWLMLSLNNLLQTMITSNSNWKEIVSVLLRLDLTGSLKVSLIFVLCIYSCCIIYILTNRLSRLDSLMFEADVNRSKSTYSNIWTIGMNELRAQYYWRCAELLIYKASTVCNILFSFCRSVQSADNLRTY